MGGILDKYTIDVKGLSDGEHTFNFPVEDRFFSIFPNEDTNEGTLEVIITLNKEVNTMVMGFNITGNVKVKCDRCLEYIDLPIETEETLFFRFGEEYIETDTDTICIPFTRDVVNVAQYIYDFIMLAIPLKRVHPDKNGESTCNRDMLNCINNIEQNNHIDPRWDKLNHLLKKQN